MSPTCFSEQTIVISNNDQLLPAFVDITSTEFTLTCCWKLTWRERLRLLFTGRLWHRVATFGRPLQPQTLAVYKPPMARTDGQ